MGNIVKRVSMDGLLEGFDVDCFAYVTPATVQDKKSFREALNTVKKNADDLSDDWQQKFVDEHFVSGKVKELSDTGEFALVDMTKDHLLLSAISDRLFAEIMGINLDPKDLSAAVAQEVKQTADAASTAQPSSTDSSTNSQATSQKS